MKQKSQVVSVSLNMLGTIIGAGIFGLPLVFAKTGIIMGSVLFFSILAVSLVLHLLFVDVIAANGSTPHKIPGYAKKYLGVWVGRFAGINVFFKTAGTILAYIIIGGNFSWVLAQGLGIGGSELFWALVFWSVGSFIVITKLKFVSAIEKQLTILLIGLMVFAVVTVLPFLDFNHTVKISFQGLAGVIGVMFFSTTALTVVPDVAAIAGKNIKQARYGIMAGVVFAGVLSWMFGMAMMLAFPQIATTYDLKAVLPPIFWWLIPSIGILAVITSFITLAQSQKNMLHEDYRLPWAYSWIAAVLVPLVAYLFLSRNFVDTIGFVGAVFTAISGILVALCAYAVLKDARADGSWIRKALGIKENKKAKVFWMWRYVSVPIIGLLVYIVVQHLMGL